MLNATQITCFGLPSAILMLQMLANPHWQKEGSPALSSHRPCRLLSLSQEKKETVWENATALAVSVGSASDDLRYLKSIALQLWLFGYEIPGGPLQQQLALAIRLHVRLAVSRVSLAASSQNGLTA